MHALLALSASHLGWLTSCAETLQLAYHHRGIAFNGLQEAINDFSPEKPENADAVLAASILLTWQTTDWYVPSLSFRYPKTYANEISIIREGWRSLMQGTTHVIRLIQDWKDISEFGEYIEEISHSHDVSRLPQLSPEEMAWLLNDIYISLRQLEPYVHGREEESKGLNDLILFVRTLAAYIPLQSADEQFELLHPLRSWLFFLPISFSKRAREDKDVIILLAYFYAVALAVEPLFPAVGATWFGSLAVGPIREIHRNLLRQRQSLDQLEQKKCRPSS